MQEHVVCTTVKNFRRHSVPQNSSSASRTVQSCPPRAGTAAGKRKRPLPALRSVFPPPPVCVFLPALCSVYLHYAAFYLLYAACFYLPCAVSTCITQRSTCTEQRLPASRSVLLPALRSVYQTYAAPTFCHLRCVCSSLHYAVSYLCCPCLPVYAAFYLHCAASATPGALFLPQPCVCVPSIRYAPFATRLASLLPLGCACLLHMECCYIRPCLLMQRCGL